MRKNEPNGAVEQNIICRRRLHAQDSPIHRQRRLKQHAASERQQSERALEAEAGLDEVVVGVGGRWTLTADCVFCVGELAVAELSSFLTFCRGARTSREPNSSFGYKLVLQYNRLSRNSPNLK